jgi:pyrroline-5-carboxylate reductase
MEIGLIGSGNMARALAVGWGEPVLCTDAGSGRAAALVAELGGEAVAGPAAVAAGADVVVLAHKPYQLGIVAAEAQAARLVVSVLGGVSLADLRQAYPQAEVAAVMPNTASAVRRGVTLLAEGSDAADRVTALFERVGTVTVLPESQLAAATGISGVGTAYVALLAEAWADAGIRAGLKPAVAGALVAETLSGGAALLVDAGHDTLAVRRAVTSPGGTTARGLRALEAAGVRDALQDAMDATAGTGR